MWINGKTVLLAIVLYLPFLAWVASSDLDRIRTAPLWLVLGYHAAAITIGSLYRQRLVRKMKLAQLESDAGRMDNPVGN